MINISFLPIFIRATFNSIPYFFRYRHGLVLQWVILMHIVAPGAKTFANMARFAPSHIMEWHFRRLINAAYWSAKIIMWKLADHAIATLPQPADGTVYFLADGSVKEKRGKKSPLPE